MWFRRKPTPDPADTMRELRQRALTAGAEELENPPDAEVLVALMEMGYAKATASLVAFADGTTSLYFSSGGGIIGAGDHPPVRAAASAFLSMAAEAMDQFSDADETPLPARGHVRFYLRTLRGTLMADGLEEDLGFGRHPLSELFHSGHQVITAIRATQGE